MWYRYGAECVFTVRWEWGSGRGLGGGCGWGWGVEVRRCCQQCVFGVPTLDCRIQLCLHSKIWVTDVIDVVVELLESLTFRTLFMIQTCCNGPGTLDNKNNIQGIICESLTGALSAHRLPGPWNSRPRETPHSPARANRPGSDSDLPNISGGLGSPGPAGPREPPGSVRTKTSSNHDYNLWILRTDGHK